MKIDRIIGILSILLQQEKVTAPYLAEKFEVSRRTINRDIEDICLAGIPLVTTQGKNGGISIMEGYRIDRTILTEADMKALLAGIKSLASVSETNRYQQLMDKLSIGNSNQMAAGSHIIIDLSSWYKTTLAPKIELLQNAIINTKEVKFQYFSPKRESHRQIEPYLLIFQWSSWYLWGYCLTQHDFRMFKLTRMLKLEITTHTFRKRALPEVELGKEQMYSPNITIEALFEPDMKWRLIDEFGLESFTQQPDQTLLFQFSFTDCNSLFAWLLSFGDKVRLLEPQELVAQFLTFTKNVLHVYD
jgi:predicted DNA-binding transcriptional regulator YafY